MLFRRYPSRMSEGARGKGGGGLRARKQDREARRCRITSGIVKSRHGEEEEEKAAAGVEVYKNIGTRDWERRIR